MKVKIEKPRGDEYVWVEFSTRFGNGKTTYLYFTEEEMETIANAFESYLQDKEMTAQEKEENKRGALKVPLAGSGWPVI